ncbi:MAG: tyrosine-type recombinase/integrase [Cycloclasticus sp.]|nr:tyrosine-type recombinase/integrase [Cycloclasticus sp.]
MKKRFNFTQARIRELPLPDTGRVDYADTDINKLVCRISHTGNKSFIVTKRTDGKLQNVTIGKCSDVTVIEARRKAQEILTAISSGIDPVAEKRKKSVSKTSLSNVLELYLSERELKPYTVENYRYKLKRGFSDWLTKPVSSITEDMILRRHKKISRTGKTTANTTMRVLRLTLNYANAVGMIDENPANILSRARLWHKSNRKDRVIPSDKLKAWHEAVEDLANQKAKVFFLMILYMGFRSGEALTLEWAQVDLKAKKITLMDTKNGSAHQLPIPVPLIPYINDLQKKTGDYKWVFTGRDSEKHMQHPREPMKVVTQASGVEFSPHDCRRTFATIAEAVNLPLTMIKRLMNHVTTNDVTGGYIVTEEETLRAAINKIASYITAKVSNDGKVIQLNIAGNGK